MPERPSPPLEHYREAQSLLRHLRVMDRVMNWIDADPRTRGFYPEIHGAYMDILREELASQALVLAFAVLELEDAYPEVMRPCE